MYASTTISTLVLKGKLCVYMCAENSTLLQITFHTPQKTVIIFVLTLVKKKVSYGC